MKVAVAVVLVVCLVCVSRAQRSCPRECGEDECCTGGSYNRHCQKLADNGERCNFPNRSNNYRTACPCKEGLVCSSIARCQPK